MGLGLEIEMRSKHNKRKKRLFISFLLWSINRRWW